jgi:hypothetical protein
VEGIGKSVPSFNTERKDEPELRRGQSG